jgi:iron complex outermembrane receptor protein
MRLRDALTALLLLYGVFMPSNSVAQAQYRLDIPAGQLASALDSLARQTHAEFIYSPDELRGVQTRGVHGSLSAQTALRQLLEGTGFVVKLHPSGAMLITPAQESLSTPKTSQASGNREPSSRLAEVMVLGTRHAEPVARAISISGVTAADSAAPVQIVGADALTRVGQSDLVQGLHQNIASLNYSTLSGDTANWLSYVRLRNLSPNNTLVLLNGKRRHGTADFIVDGGPFQGAAGADLSLIPLQAVHQVEVLTDDAAAQYGTDAVAGVINISLKHDNQGGAVTATVGQYFDHQGTTGDASVNVGLAPIPNSFLNLTAEIKFHGHSDVVGPDPLVYNHDGYDNLALYPNVVTVPGYPYIEGGRGDPRYRMFLLSYNSGFDLGSGAQFYSVGTFGYRDAANYHNYRLPNKIPAVWPLGFNPIEALDEFDFEVTAGIKGTVFGGWLFDLSSTYGSDNDSIYVNHSANVSLFHDTGYTPTNFHAGALIATLWTTNLDLNRNFDVGMPRPLNVAFGLEGRRQSYDIDAGDPASRYKEGSQAYSGFTPTDAGYHARSNQAFYVDLALSPVRGLQLDAAGRFVHFSDFGDASVGKLTGRYDFTPKIAVRGTISSGFRAPTLAEEHYSATNISPTAGFVQLAPNSPGARLIGIEGLKPETSTNYSLGLVLHPLPDLIATLDAYQIDIHNRIVGSGNIYGSGNPGGPNSPAVVEAIRANGNVLDPTVTQTGVNVFINGADTRTRGVDFVVAHADDLGSLGRLSWSFSGSYGSTIVTGVLPPPVQIQPQAPLNETALSFLTTASPNYRIIFGAVWEKDKWTLNLRQLIYGHSSETIEGDDGRFYSVRINATPITNIAVSYAPTDKVRFTIGADNVFNTFPNKVNPELIRTYLIANDGAGAYTSPDFAPYGVNGGYYYGRVTIGF